MFLIVGLVIVGCVSVVVSRTIQHGIDRRQLVENSYRSPSPSERSAKAGLMAALLTVAVFVPLLFVAYLAIALVRHVLGQ
jgi:Fe2+ transport system protein B